MFVVYEKKVNIYDMLIYYIWICICNMLFIVIWFIGIGLCNLWKLIVGEYKLVYGIFVCDKWDLIDFEVIDGK